MRMLTFAMLCTLVTYSIIHTAENTDSECELHLLNDRPDHHQLEVSALKLSALMRSPLTECKAALADASNYQEIEELLNTANKTTEEKGKLYNFFNNWLITQIIDSQTLTTQLDDDLPRLKSKAQRMRYCCWGTWTCAAVTTLTSLIIITRISHTGEESYEG